MVVGIKTLGISDHFMSNYTELNAGQDDQKITLIPMFFTEFWLQFFIF